MSVTISGLIILIASQFVPTEEVDTVLSAVGILISWYGRIRMADVNFFGIRK